MKRMRLVLAVAALSAVVIPTPAPAAVGGAALGGFVSDAMATPIRIEIYEPTIPIPAEPQAEFNIAYTRTKASTGPSGGGRASWLWPGDSVGEGFKTIIEGLGLPPELGEKGYPVQVKSQSPGDPSSQSDEPFPGIVMRTRSDERGTVARVAFSAGDPSDADPADAGTSPPPVAEPSLLAGTPLDLVGREDDEAPQGAPGLGQLAALVNAAAVTSSSRSEYPDDAAVATGATRITDLSLLGGLVTADSVTSMARTTSTLRGVVSEHTLRISGFALAGNGFTVTKHGVEAAGHQAPIPGLPDDVGKALEQLGISFVLPASTRTANGTQGSETVRGLQVVVDTSRLRSRLGSGALDSLVYSLPDQLAELKKVLGASLHLSPRIVLTLGSARSEAVALPPVDVGGTAPSNAEQPSANPAPPSSAASASGIPGSAAPAAGSAPEVAGALPTTTADVRPAAAGLPPLDSVPGMLMTLGLVLAAGLGWWFQKIGGLVLGAAGSCAHGLSTGVPDLRKA